MSSLICARCSFDCVTDVQFVQSITLMPADCAEHLACPNCHSHSISNDLAQELRSAGVFETALKERGIDPNVQHDMLLDDPAVVEASFDDPQSETPEGGSPDPRCVASNRSFARKWRKAKLAKKNG